MNPSGSSIERGVNCPASFALPQAPHTGEDAIRGTANHEKIDDGLAKSQVDDLPSVVRRLTEGASSMSTEAAYALDVERGAARFIGTNIGRNYGELGSNEIALTLDLVLHRDGAYEIVDWKSRQRVTRARDNWQIRAGAVALLKTGVAKSEVRGTLAYLDDGEIDSATFDTFDASRFFDETRAMLKRIRAAEWSVAQGNMPSVSSGPWCRYCPAMPYCPAQTRQAMVLIGELDAIEQKVAFMSPEQVGRAWEKKKEIEKLLERIDGALRLRVQTGLVTLSNGKRLATVDAKRSSFDVLAAKKRLEELGEDPARFMKTTAYTTIKEVNQKEMK